MDAVFFDLDGTLADTAIDLAAALNQLLEENSREPLSLKVVREIASHGSVAMIKKGFDIERDHANFTHYQQCFLTLYRQCLTDNPYFMKGMDKVLESLAIAEIPWGIVTNKPAYLTEPLVAAMSFPYPPRCVVSGDSVSRSKPHPDSLLHACQLLKVSPQRCIYIGDAERDIQAGNAAGMVTVAALFGYVSKQDKSKNWAADYAVVSSENLLETLASVFATN